MWRICDSGLVPSCWLLILLISYSSVGEVIDSRGREFVLGFMMNGGLDEEDPAPLEVQLSSWVHENVTVNFSVPADGGMMENITRVIPPGQVLSVELPPTLRMEEGTIISNKGVLITADYDVSVYGFNKGEFSHDSFLALPVDALKETYYAVTMLDRSSSRCPVQVGIVSAAYRTTLKFIVPKNPELHIVYGGSVYNETQTFEVTLDPYQMFQMQNWNDLTGLYIRADHPVAVYSGATCAALIGRTTDLTLSQLPPIDYWGRHFIIIPSPTSERGDVIKIVGREPSTVIKIEIPHLSENMAVILDEGGLSAELSISSSENIMVMTSSKPVLVVYLTQSFQPGTTRGDTSMTVLPAVEQYIPYAEYTGVRTGSSKRRLNHQAIVVCQEQHEQDIAISSSSTAHTPGIQWEKIGMSGFSYTILPLARQTSYTFQSVQPADPNTHFGLWLIGYMAFEGYGHPGGLTLRAEEKPMEVPEPTQGPLAFLQGLVEGAANGKNFYPEAVPVPTTADPSEATIPPKVEKIVAITAAISVVVIVVAFKVVGCFYTLRESKV